jgi:hypothetical protein
MRIWIKAVALLLAAGALPAQAGVFSKHATTVADIHGSLRPMTVTAPDGRTRAVARFTEGRTKEDDGKFTVFLGINGFDFAGGAHAELLWSPDSRALAVMANDGDTQGAYLTSILVRKPTHGWRRVNLTEKVVALYGHVPSCADVDEPNVVPLGWTSGRRLIVGVTLPAKPGCTAGGLQRAYVVDVPKGRVLMAIDPRTAKRRYRRMMGKAIVEPGLCARRPGSCWIEQAESEPE